MTCRLRVSVEPVQFVAWAVVKQGDPPQGPLAPVISASVLRLSRSLFAISWSRIEVSSS